VLTDYQGTWVLGVSPEAVQTAWSQQVQLPAQLSGQVSLQGVSSKTVSELESLNPLSAETSFWLVDPLGNLMMRFPQDPDPAKMKKDLIRLLKASRIG